MQCNKPDYAMSLSHSYTPINTLKLMTDTIMTNYNEIKGSIKACTALVDLPGKLCYEMMNVEVK